jgi:Tol biopolymer transport system component
VSRTADTPSMRRFLAAATALAAALSAGVAGAGTNATPQAKIVYSSPYKAGTAIFVTSPKGTGTKRLTSPPRFFDANPTWSPTGGRIAFESTRVGDVNIFTVRSDGTHVRELTFADGFDGDPSWSRENKIAFESDRTGNTEIWVVNPDGSGEKQITTDPSCNGDPAWSPDGSKIVFTSTRGGDREIWVMNADGSDQTRLTSGPGISQNPSWSSDGTSIAFDSNRNGNFEIYVMNADGSDPTRLTDNGALDALPSWSPDSRHLAFVSDRFRRGIRRIYTMDADGAHVRMVSRGSFDMSPDWARG